MTELSPTYRTYRNAVLRHWLTHPGQRWGQSGFNVLYRMHPEIADQVRGSSLDPFHNDARFPHLLAWLKVKWIEPSPLIT